MNLEYQVLLAVGLDLLVGDPRWLPHPVKGIGRLAVLAEPLARKMIPWPRAAGIAAWLCIVGAAGAAAWGLVRLAGMAHPVAADVVSILLIYTTVCARDLVGHSCEVYRALRAGDLPLARRKVGRIVGRDTAELDESGIVRADVESVAESTVDGVTAPLFYAILAGPVGAIVYRAVNTLDSMYGYRNERYLKFGWAAARMDDLANFIPARMTGPLAAVAAALLMRRPIHCLRILVRDCRKHQSPNAGFGEAAMAGALGVQLGGVNHYHGEPLAKPTIGEPLEPLRRRHILWANAMALTTLAVFLAAGIGLRIGIVALVHYGRTLT